MTHHIHRVAVLGAGTMGAAIAAHAANAGLSVDLLPPERGKNIYAGGKTLLAALEIGVRQLQWARYATEYDGVVGGHLARVLCGGELSTPQWVTEDYMLKLEREAFLSLLHNEQTLERIQAMLTTGKPLRN